MTAVTCILPVYNEHENIIPLCDEIESVGKNTDYKWHILLVDDGSTDGSTEVIRELTEKRGEQVGSIHFSANNGQSAAFAAGFEYVETSLVATLDADGQNDPADLPAMLAKLGDCDMVAGYRSNREDNWPRKFGSWLANKVRNFITGDNIIDTGCSLKVFKREVVKSFPVFEGMHRFFPTLARMKGFEVQQHPTNHRPRQEGQTKYTLSGRLFTTVWDLWAVRWMQKRVINYEIDEARNIKERC